MVVKSCARSHGHPVPGVRSAAIISIRRVISFEGVTFAMSDDPRRPGALRCYQGGMLQCKLSRVHLGQSRPIRRWVLERIPRANLGIGCYVFDWDCSAA